MKIDLVKADMEAGKSWMQQVHEEKLKQARKAIRAKHRAKYLEQQKIKRSETTRRQDRG
jgi:hypothetical protein